MIKKITLFLLPVFLSFCAPKSYAQTAASYAFSKFNSVYQSIDSSGTPVTNIMADDVTQTGIPIGFSFSFCGTAYTTLSACSNGWISLANSSSNALTNSTSVPSAGTLMPFWDDMHGGYTTALSNAYYRTTGTAPNRVFTFEWKNWSRFGSGSISYLSFEVKLYETSNVIQFIYKPTNVYTAFSATIGIANSTTDWQTLDVPTPAALSSATTFNVNIATQPSDGQVFQYSPANACSGTPTVTATIPATACAGTAFAMQVMPPGTGLTYDWQKSTNGTAWTSFATTQGTTDIITVPTYYRCLVTCTASALTYTTATQLVNINPFYKCYCASAATSGIANGDVGNVTVTQVASNTVVLNNGNATPLVSNTTAYNSYSAFYNLTPTPLNKGVKYRFKITEIIPTATATTPNVGAIYLDINRNGIFENNERIINGTIATGTQVFSDTFTIPVGTPVGITGMRVIVYPGGSTIVQCGNNSYGETEDYLVNIDYEPCNGPVNAGLAYSTDTAMCAGYSITLTDSTYEKQKSALSRVWEQSSTFGATWTVIPNSASKDSVQLIFPQKTMYYRVRMICETTGDTTFSNVVTVSLKPPYKCYCYSMAEGGTSDTSDIGSFTIANFLTNTGGPHLLNPIAIRSRTDYTDLGPVILYKDSTYTVNVYHTMDVANHANALVTLFMDFNSNHVYDYNTNEAIYLYPATPANWITTNPNGWYVENKFTVPHAVITNVPTGMRLILNNDIDVNNVASRTACGGYTSGETEDYVVIFKEHFPTGINTIADLTDFIIYPNPNDGIFNISFNTVTPIPSMQVTVTDITGRIIEHNEYSNLNGRFKKEINLSNKAKGIYLIEVKANKQRIIEKVTVK